MYHFSAKENCECEKCGESIKFYHLFECKANSLTLSQAASLYIYGIFHVSFIFHVCINIMLYADGVLPINIKELAVLICAGSVKLSSVNKFPRICTLKLV